MTFPSPAPDTPRSLALFCKVVDNFGDIGICWRLARQLAHEHGVAVTLWVDDLASFRRIWPAVEVSADTQWLSGVEVRHWRRQEGEFDEHAIPDVVIEFFGCDLPEGYIAAMARRPLRPVWLNLEGLTAEEWVEGCHTLPSTHPRLPLVKHFFFPGFTAKTGGLMREAALDDERQAFQNDPARRQAFLHGLGLSEAEIGAFTVSLFCYPHAPASALFEVWRDSAHALVCLVPEGVADTALHAFLQGPAVAGASASQGALTVRVLPFVPQPDYDRLLWSSDLNFVRGEDSFVRAQWAQRPFVWHIYPQDENLHHKKLRAFLQRYAPDCASLNAFSLRWNGASAGALGDAASWAGLWSDLHADLPALRARARAWQGALDANGEMTANLLAFAASLRDLPTKTRV